MCALLRFVYSTRCHFVVFVTFVRFSASVAHYFVRFCFNHKFVWQARFLIIYIEGGEFTYLGGVLNVVVNWFKNNTQCWHFLFINGMASKTYQMSIYRWIIKLLLFLVYINIIRELSAPRVVVVIARLLIEAVVHWGGNSKLQLQLPPLIGNALRVINQRAAPEPLSLVRRIDATRLGSTGVFFVCFI